MDLRRVQRTGGSFLIPLLKTWARRNGLNRGLSLQSLRAGMDISYQIPVNHNLKKFVAKQNLIISFLVAERGRYSLQRIRERLNLIITLSFGFLAVFGLGLSILSLGRTNDEQVLIIIGYIFCIAPVVAFAALFWVISSVNKEIKNSEDEVERIRKTIDTLQKEQRLV